MLLTMFCHSSLHFTMLIYYAFTVNFNKGRFSEALKRPGGEFRIPDASGFKGSSVGDHALCS